MPRKKTEITTTETSQLSVFDYSSLDANTAKLAKETAIEIKAREKAIWENIIEIGNRLIEVKNALPHGKFGKWIDNEFQWSDDTAERYMKIAKELGNIPISANLRNLKMSAITTLAKTFSDADEETKEKILEQVETKTEETGKALTEKQINELPEVKRLKEELKAQQEAKKKLEEDLKEAKQGELFFQEKLDKKIEDYNDLQDSFVQKLQEIKGFEETINNQNKQIQELNSLTSQLEKRQQEIAEKEDLVMTQFANLSETVDSEVRAKLQKEKDLALADVEKQKNDLKKEQEKVKKELGAVQAEKDRFTRANKWVELMTEYNLEFAKMCDRLKYISSELNNAPKFEDLGEYKDTVKQTAQMQMDKFSDNLDAFGKFNSRIIMAISKFDKNPLKAYDVVATEVSDD